MRSYEEPSISLIRRNKLDCPLNSFEATALHSLSSSIEWIGIEVSPFCVFFSCYLQQKGQTALVKDLVLQINMFRGLKKHGTAISLNRTAAKGQYEVSVVAFSDANCPNKHDQLGYIAGLLFGEIKVDSVFQFLAWSSQKKHRTVKSIG